MMKTDKRPQWLQDLDVVATTPEQAKQIIKRNRVLLRELKKAEPELLSQQIPSRMTPILSIQSLFSGYGNRLKVDEGCPHCNKEFDCNGCAWDKPMWNKQEYYPCVYASFDGLTHNDVSSSAPIRLVYAVSAAAIESMSPLRRFKIKDIRDCISDIRTFLEAHVTWGRDVIRRAKK